MIGCAMLFYVTERRRTWPRLASRRKVSTYAAYQDGDAIEVVSTRGRARVTVRAIVFATRRKVGIRSYSCRSWIICVPQARSTVTDS
jgi:hypothetical protein